MTTVASILESPSLLRLLTVAHQTSLNDPSAATTLLDQALDQLKGLGARSRPAAGLSPIQRDRLQVFIEARLHEPLSLERLSREAGLSPSYLCRAFRISFGASPHAWIIGRRLERARLRMRGTDEPLSQIALSCGFADQAHFTRHFARDVGVSPRRWRREQAATETGAPSSFKATAD